MQHRPGGDSGGARPTGTRTHISHGARGSGVVRVAGAAAGAAAGATAGATAEQPLVKLPEG
eukprot:7619195-Alexandrium_andersonii.AAC.1